MNIEDVLRSHMGVGSGIKSIQTGTAITTGTNADVTIAISSVNVSNTIVFFNPSMSGMQASTNNPIAYLPYLKTLSNTSFVAGGNYYDYSSTKTHYTFEWYVIEFDPSVIKSIQRGIGLAVSPATTVTITINPVNYTKSIILYQNSASVKTNSGVNVTYGVYTKTKNTDNIVVQANYQAYTTPYYEYPFSYQIVEFK